jgi:hypothetical protein
LNISITKKRKMEGIIKQKIERERERERERKDIITIPYDRPIAVG